ncbi:MAG: hypothetical protein EBQ95_04795 [Gammaproteobacteria bacterium]|nr:hypothetical protein [Gammaproteobacteria bacterium]
MENAQPEMTKARVTTYDFLMAQNILGKFNILLSNDEIFRIIQEKNDVNYLLICSPIENIYNQMIFAQIKSYELFVQKRMMDYVLGTAPTPEAIESAEGGDIQYPEAFMNLQKHFGEIQARLLELDNLLLKLVSETNQFIKRYVTKNIVSGNQNAYEIPQELKNNISIFEAQAQEMRVTLLATRDEWKSFASNVCKTLSELGGYFVEEDIDLAQRAEINFFQQLGVLGTEKNAI